MPSTDSPVDFLDVGSMGFFPFTDIKKIVLPKRRHASFPFSEQVEKDLFGYH